MLLRLVSRASVLLLGCVSAFGQAPGGLPQGLPQGLPPGVEALAGKALSEDPPLIMLMGDKKVQAELKIERSQKQAIDAIFVQLKGAAMAHIAAGADQAAMLADFESRKKSTNKELEGILSAEQMGRLKQIALQVQGPQAILAPEFAEEMDLSEDQIEQIQKMTRRNDKALAAILDKDQRAKWREKIGKPFKGTIPMLPFGTPKPQR